MPATDAAARKKALEEKKERLAKLRQQKLEREKTKLMDKQSGRSTRSRAAAVEKPVEVAPKKSAADILSQVQDITGNLQEPAAVVPTSAASASSNLPSQEAGDAGISSLPHTQIVATAVVPQVAHAVKRPPPKLHTSSISLLELTPREVISYAKETQTSSIATQSINEDDDIVEPEKPKTSEQTAAQEAPVTDEDAASDQTAPKPPPKPKELTQEELDSIQRQDGFWNFLGKASRVVERALTETQVDIMTDYQADGAENDLLDPLNGEALVSSRVFQDQAWTRGRIIQAMEWSTVHPELLYAAYGSKQAGNLHEHEGVVCIWNTKYKKETPEFVFHCSSPITSLSLSPYSPNLVIGGTYSGQIVIWDNRSRKRIPVQRSKQIAKSHTRPIFCLDLVGSKNSHNLISVSSDGRVCSWSLDMLSQPQEPPFDLTHPFDKRRSISVTSSSFPRANINQFLVGCEDGGVYQARRHGTKSGVTDMFGSGSAASAFSSLGSSGLAASTLAGYASGSSSVHNLTTAHSGPVMGLSCHQAAGTLDFSDLFLTASADWSIKLWSTKYNTGSAVIGSGSGEKSSSGSSSVIPPIHTFENNQDYLYDIAWSPAHPALFACGDGQANVDLWNINNHTEMPYASHKVKGGSNCISKLSWSTKGELLSVGDDTGRIELLEVNEQLYQPRNDEWSKFMSTVQELLQASSEETRTEHANKTGMSYTRMGAGDHRSKYKSNLISSIAE